MQKQKKAQLTFDIVFAGVGGQGVLSIASIIARAALIEGLYFRQSEVHGMSQRGGVVHAHMRLSNLDIASDIIPHGGADMILSMEPLESLRYMKLLKPDGIIISGSEPVLNIPDYPDMHTVIRCIKKNSRACVIDTLQAAESAGNRKVNNMVLLGAALCALPIKKNTVERSIREVFAQKHHEMLIVNLRAFELGIALHGAA